MDSSLEFSIVSSNSLVASNSNRDSSIGSCDLSFNFGDSVGQSRGSIWDTSIRETCIRKTNSRVCLSLSLSNVVNSRDNMSVVSSHLGSEEGTGANSQRALTGIIDLSVEGRGSKDGWDLVDSSLEFSIISSNSFVASNSNRDSSIGSCDLSFNFGDSVGQSRGNGSSIGETSIWESSVGE